jgi:hypothetical protein
MILDDISYAEANYPRVAVVDFDHGMGRDDYQGLCEFHFMFEDNIGTAIGDRDHTIWVPDNGVYDMDIYPRTALGKVNFAFINTCYSANLTNPETGQPWQGVVAGTYRARGMPFAWARSQVGYGGISSYGYSDPDGGDFCYIGFPFGSAALNQTIGGSGPQYWLWVRDFFWFASSPDNSINNALDDASFEHYDEPFSNTNLFQNFSAFWPLWNETSQEWEGGAIPNCHMVVYGNGNLHLYRKGGIWHLDGNALDSSHNNDGAIYGATWTTGKFGSALSFDGNDRVQIADSESLNIKNALTISYWVKRTADSGGYHVLKKDAFGGLKDLGSNLFNFWTYHVGGQDGWQISTDTITLNQFHLVTLTWTPGHKKAYVDGSLIAEKTDSRTDDLRQDASEPVFIGNSQGWHAYNFAGIIDEVRIYDYVLSAGQIADNAAVASCHFNGGNSAYDSAPYVNTGTVYGASWATGLRTSSGFSYGLSFDGSDDYVNIPDSDSLDLSSAVTVEAWIKPSRLNVWQSPLEKGAHNDWAYGFYIEPAGGNIGFEIGKEGSPVTWAGAVAPVNSYLEVGKMTHIVGTADSATGKVYLYIDGYKRGEGNFSGQINTNSIPFQVGKRYEGGYFGGVIDEVRIYDRVLSASEIYSYYMANKPVHWLIVDGFSVDGIGTDIWIDGQYAGYNTAVSSVSQGTHTVEVNDWFVHPYYGYFVFDHFAYDSTTDYNNPMTLTVSKDTAVFADYYYYGW